MVTRLTQNHSSKQEKRQNSFLIFFLSVGLIGIVLFIISFQKRRRVFISDKDLPMPPDVSSAAQQVTLSPSSKSIGKLSSRLKLLLDPAISGLDSKSQAQKLSLTASGPDSLQRNEKEEYLVYIRVTNTSETSLNKLKDGGVDVTHVAEQYKTITAYVNLKNLPQVTSLEFVENIQEVLVPGLNIE